MRRKNSKPKLKAESTSTSNEFRRKITDSIEPKWFAIGFERELCNPTGYEVCFDFNEENGEKNTWWYEYSSSIKKCYGNPHH